MTRNLPPLSQEETAIFSLLDAYNAAIGTKHNPIAWIEKLRKLRKKYQINMNVLEWHQEIETVSTLYNRTMSSEMNSKAKMTKNKHTFSLLTSVLAAQPQGPFFV